MTSITPIAAHEPSRTGIDHAFNTNAQPEPAPNALDSNSTYEQRQAYYAAWAQDNEKTDLIARGRSDVLEFGY